MRGQTTSWTTPMRGRSMSPIGNNSLFLRFHVLGPRVRTRSRVHKSGPWVVSTSWVHKSGPQVMSTSWVHKSGGFTNERPWTDHVISGPMRGRKKMRMPRRHKNSVIDGHYNSLTDSAQRAKSLKNKALSRTKKKGNNLYLPSLSFRYLTFQ